VEPLEHLRSSGARIGDVLQLSEQLEVLARGETGVVRRPLRDPADPRVRLDVAVSARHAQRAQERFGHVTTGGLSGGTISTSTATGASLSHFCNSRRSAKNSHTARPAARSGKDTRMPGNP